LSKYQSEDGMPCDLWDKNKQLVTCPYCRGRPNFAGFECDRCDGRGLILVERDKNDDIR